MKQNSIKQTLPRMAKLMVMVLIVLLLPVNIVIQLYFQHRNQKESSYEVFGQLRQLIEMNERDLMQAREEFSEQCIRSAEMAAYFVEHYPLVTSDFTLTRELAEKLDVDELHYFTPEGEIYFGTHPEYYGYTFRSGKQMEYFLPMLQDRSMKLCQDIMPNTAEGKEMQYAAVWMEDGTGILQIGMEPRRLLKEMEERSMAKMLTSLPMDMRGYLHIVDRDTWKIIASTEERLIGEDVRQEQEEYDGEEGVENFHYRINGKRYCVYTQNYGKYMLLRTYHSEYPLKETITSTGMMLIYVCVVAMIVIGLITWYVKRKLSNNLMAIVEEVKKIGDGKLENIELKTNITEFDELIFYINQLMQSIRLNWSKLSYVIDKGHLPIGILEYNTFYKKTFMNERLLTILGMENPESSFSEELAQRVRNTLEDIKARCDRKDSVYKYDRNGTLVYLRIEKVTDEQSTTYYVTDVSLWWSEIHLLRQQSNRDVLTNLYNRRGFNERLESLFAEPEKIGYGMMIMLDADGLKKINDIYGHHIGDEYLKKIADVIRESLGENSVYARFGGDEFAVFLYQYSSYQEVENAVQRLREKRGVKFLPDQQEIGESVEFSLGCAYYPMDGTDYHLLMHLADENMYQEKRMRKK